jgi:PAS domain S-box-containing protein
MNSLSPTNVASPDRTTALYRVGQTVLETLSASGFVAALQTLADETRVAIGAHQCAMSYAPFGDFTDAVHAVSLSEKYAKYRTYDAKPTGVGIWGLVGRDKLRVRLTQEQVEALPSWRNFSDVRDARGLEHPPMRGWLAVPVLRPAGDVLGVLQLSDKWDDKEFTDQDLQDLQALAKLFAPTMELNLVNQQLKQRTEEVNRSRDELELRVNERTKDLREANERLSREIAQRNQAQSALRLSEERFRLLSKATNDGLWDYDLLKGELWVSDTQATLFGQGQLDPDILRSWALKIHPEDREATVSSFQNALASATEQWTAEYRILRPDGTKIPVIEKAYIVRNEQGQAIRVVGATRDLTERKRIEEERLRHQYQSRLQHAQKLESLGIMAGGIAHDFNNLLASILGYIDLASLDIAQPAEAINHLQAALKSTRKAAELTRAMLTYSGQNRMRLQQCNLSDLLESMGPLMRASISTNCQLVQKLQCDVPLITVDVALVQQVILNLLINASEAIGEDPGVITLSTGVHECNESCIGSIPADNDDFLGGLCVFVKVADTGCGMSETTKSRIFDPFYTTKFTGRGLGLSAALGIVRSHRGAIKVFSSPGEGATFKVLFPVVGAGSRA